MSCDEIQEQLVETARARVLSSDLRKIVFGHAAGCASCGRRLDNEQRLTHALSELSISTEGAPARMEQAILRQLKVVPMRRAWPIRWVWSGAAVAAAAATFFVMSSQIRMPQAFPQSTPQSAPHVLPHSTLQSTLQSTPQTLPQSQPQAMVVNALAQDDSSDGFTPLPYAPELGPEEQAEMVRVQMPREALLSMGVPVDGASSDDQIQADVLVGMDGTARAIRVRN